MFNSLVGMVGGSALLFGALVIAGVALENHSIPLPDDWDNLDGFTRVLLGLTFFAGVGGLGLLALAARIWQAAATHRSLRQLGPELLADNAVPIRLLRDLAASPYGLLAGTGMVTAIGGGVLFVCCAITIVVMAVDGDDVEYAVGATAISLVLTVLGGVLWRRAGAADQRWQKQQLPGCEPARVAAANGAAHMVARRQRKARSAPAVRASWPERLARRVLPAGLVVVLAGIVVALIATFTRQPCRTCDPRYYSDPVELLLDSGFLGGAILVAVGTGVVTAGVVVELVASFRSRDRLVRLAGATELAEQSRPDDKVLTDLLTTSPTRVTATVMAMWSAALLWIGLAAIAQAADGQPPFADRTTWWGLVVLAGLLAAGQFVLRWSGERTRVATAAAVREAWPVPDPVPQSSGD